MTMAILLEVMDKEPALLTIWIMSTVIGISGYYLCKMNPKFYLLFYLLSMIFGVGFFAELNDEIIRPAIIQEVGFEYIYQSYIAILIGVSLPIIGAVVGYRKRRKLTSNST